MEIKISTKEKFTVLTPICSNLTDSVAEELNKTCIQYISKKIKNIILNLNYVELVTLNAAKNLANLQQSFYESNVSFVICELQKSVEVFLENEEILEMLNTTPTESEAWDIVQMEEIERELFSDED